MNANIKPVVSLFSGCGGMDLGFTNAGFDVIWANEFDKQIVPTYKANHYATQLVVGDINKIDIATIPDCVGIVGGPPCQSWSVAGKQQGINDPRGRLFKKYIEVLAIKQPLFFVAENVPGILAPKHADAFEDILDGLTNAGYRVVCQKLNALHYGVPQTRERVFFVGYRNDFARYFHFSNVQRVEPHPTLIDAIGNLNLTTVPNNEIYNGNYSSRYMSRQRLRGWSEPSFTIVASSTGVPLHPQASPMVRVGREQFMFDPNTPAPYRRLTVRECARIQTFPDSFVFHYNSVHTGYKMVGNAVPVKLAQAIANTIYDDIYR